MENDTEIQSISGTIDVAGDSDVFQLELEPGVQYRVTVTGAVNFNIFSDNMMPPRTDIEALFQDRSTAAVIDGAEISRTFVAQPGTTYFAEVETVFDARFDSPTDPVPYTLAFVEAPDAVLAGPQTTASVSVGGTFEGTYETLQDQDWVRLNVAAGSDYLAILDDRSEDALFVIGFDSQTGEQVDLPFLGQTPSSQSQVGFSAQAGVDYFAVAQDISTFGDNEYTISLTTLPGDVTPSNASTTVSVDPNSSTQGELDAVGDYDWLRLNTTVGASYGVTLDFPTGFLRDDGFDVIEVDNATGRIVAVVDRVLPSLDYTFSAEAGSSYFVQVRPTDNAENNGTYEVTLTEFADDFTNTTATTGLLGVGETLTPVLNVDGDYDLIRLDVEAGASYIAIAENTIFHVVRDDRITLDSTRPLADINAFNDPLAISSYFNSPEDRREVRVDIEEGFEYFIVVQTLEFPPAPVFTLVEVTPDTLGNAGTDVTLAPSQTIQGIFSGTTDQDWIRLDLAEGQSAVLTTTDVRRPDIFSVSDDGTVALLSLQDFFTLSGLTMQTVVTGRAGETLYLQARAAASAALEASYTVSLAPIADDFTNDPASAVTIGTDPVQPTAGADLLEGTNAAEEINGLGGDDTINGLGGNDTLIGNDGSDIIDAGLGADLVFGGTGADTVSAGLGQDTVTGGNGRDLVFLGAGDDLFNDNTQGGEFGQDTVFGGNGNDTIEGGNGNDEFLGGDGNDVINARLGADLVFAGNGADTISAGNGADVVFGGNGRDLVFLNQGNDLFEDNDQGGEFGQDTVFGGFGDDTITGGAGADQFFGQDGNDWITGGLGADEVFGGNGADTIESGNGNDTVFGGNGRDVALLGDGDDLFIDNDQGGEFGQDFVSAGNGRDTIEGGAGADSFFGGNGADVINAGLGADTIMGGNGNDTLTGGNGADIFVFNAIGEVTGVDLVTDYELGADMLQVQFTSLSTVSSVYDAGTNTVTVSIFDEETVVLQSTQDLSGFVLEDNVIIIG